MNHNYILKLKTAPTSEPLTLSETKLFLRVDGTAEDNLISSLITTARIAAENYCRKSFITQTWQMIFDEYAPGILKIFRSPVQSISSVKLISRDGGESTLASTYYYMNAAKNRLIFDAIAFAHKVQIEYVAGYGAAADVPAPIKQAILNHIVEIYEKRGGEVDIPASSCSLYQQFRELIL